MEDVFEIRIHGRGGQGGKTAAQFIAETALAQGKEIQAFPEYGPERTGAPVNAYVRIADEKIRIYHSVKHPNAVLVIDPTLMNLIDVTQGMQDGSILIVNSSKSPEDIRKLTGFKGKIYTVDATKISIEATGINKPNIPIIGALIKATEVIPKAGLEDVIKGKFLKKLGEEKTAATVAQVDRAYAEAIAG
jgi:pyruvate ferredoxin oxidoreductase gamma subunit